MSPACVMWQRLSNAEKKNSFQLLMKIPWKGFYRNGILTFLLIRDQCEKNINK